MTGQYRCLNCGFVGYPEVARRESLWKNLLGFFIYFKSSSSARQRIRHTVDYSTWNQLTTTQKLRCPQCRQIGSMEPIAPER